MSQGSTARPASDLDVTVPGVEPACGSTETDTPAGARAAYRRGAVMPTSGHASGFAQANLVILPRDWAWDMLLFSQRNPQPVPLLDVTEPGSPRTVLAPDADLRTDLPLYRVWRKGQLVEEVPDVSELWTDDLVSFLIGCSFSFERSLLDAGVPVRNIEQGRNVAMFRTNRPCRPAGRLSGELVVSMRPIPASLVPTAVQITGRMPGVHGAPVHVGVPARLGIADVGEPDFGEAIDFEDGDVPVFWACGVTPHVALMASQPPFAITHAPGHMLVTDVPDSVYRQP